MRDVALAYRCTSELHRSTHQRTRRRETEDMFMLKLLQERDVEESLPKELDENDVNKIMLENDDYMKSLIKEPNESSDSELVKKLLSTSSFFKTSRSTSE